MAGLMVNFSNTTVLDIGNLKKEKMNFEILFGKIPMRIFIRQPPTVQGLKCCHQKEQNFKMQFKFCRKPHWEVSNFGQCDYIECALWGYQNLKKETHWILSGIVSFWELRLSIQPKIYDDIFVTKIFGRKCRNWRGLPTNWLSV